MPDETDAKILTASPSRTGWGHHDALVLFGWWLSSSGQTSSYQSERRVLHSSHVAVCQYTITSCWMKQLTWLRIVHSGDWCLRLALCCPSVTLNKFVFSSPVACITCTVLVETLNPAQSINQPIKYSAVILIHPVHYNSNKSVNCSKVVELLQWNSLLHSESEFFDAVLIICWLTVSILSAVVCCVRRYTVRHRTLPGRTRLTRPRCYSVPWWCYDTWN